MKTLEEIENIRQEKRKELDIRVNTNADTREKLEDDSIIKTIRGLGYRIGD